MAVLPNGPQLSVKYTLTGPDGSIAVFNDSTDANYVGAITEVTGFESPEVRDNAENLVGMDGGIHGNFYYGRRPMTMSGTIFNVVSNEDRNKKLTKLIQATNAMQEDATLEWTPEGGEATFVKVRRAQPLRVTGGWVKDFQISLVASDPRLYSTALTTVTSSEATVSNFVQGFSANQSFGVAVDATFVYWADGAAKAIGRAKLNGSGVEPKWITNAGINYPTGIAVDAGHVYWTDVGLTGANGTGKIGRAAIGGGTVEPAWITGASYPIGIAVDAGHVYWTNVGIPTSGTIGRAAIGGGTVEQTWITDGRPGAVLHGLAVDANFVYWGTRGQGCIGRAKIGGTGVEPTWMSGLTDPSHPAVNASKIYWSSYEGRAVGRANLNGTSPEQSWRLAPKGPFGTAVNATNIFFNDYDTGQISRGPLESPICENKGTATSYPVITVEGLPEFPTVRNRQASDSIAIKLPVGKSPNQSFMTGIFTVGVTSDTNFLYWIWYGEGLAPVPNWIGRSRLDGSEKNPNWLALPTGEQAQFVTCDNKYFYYTDAASAAIFRVSITGVGGVTEIVKPVNQVNDIAVDGTYIYWTANIGRSIGRAKLDGTAVEPEWIKLPLTGGRALTVDAGHVYWSYFKEKGGTPYEDRLGRAAINGTAIEAEWVTGLGNTVIGITTDSTYIYGACLKSRTIGRALLATGGSVEPNWITGALNPNDVTVSGNTIYWGNPVPGFNNSVIGRMTLAGSSTMIIDTLNRTVVLGTGESIYRAVDFGATEWWGLGPGQTNVDLYAERLGEALTMKVAFRSAWI